MKQKYIYVLNASYGAKWCKKKGGGKGHYFDCNTLMNMITWLVKNTYVQVGNKIYKQIIVRPLFG